MRIYYILYVRVEKNWYRVEILTRDLRTSLKNLWTRLNTDRKRKIISAVFFRIN